MITNMTIRPVVEILRGLITINKVQIKTQKEVQRLNKPPKVPKIDERIKKSHKIKSQEEIRFNKYKSDSISQQKDPKFNLKASNSTSLKTADTITATTPSMAYTKPIPQKIDSNSNTPSDIITPKSPQSPSQIDFLQKISLQKPKQFKKPKLQPMPINNE
jgi:hypothetical protein